MGERTMKSYLAKPGDIERKHVLFDAAGVPVGRLAVKIANALRGKDKPTYTPHVDTGCNVIVVNAEKALLTGNKNKAKIYEDYSGYQSGHKLHTAEEVRAKKPERLIKDAVWGMLPHGRLGRAQYKKLRVYAGSEHPHQAQKPEQATV
jgi:large subunit ribosomal protein L13